jgi:hypothetical protein
VLKINTPTPIYLATRDLSLDSTFDGQVLNYDNYLTDLSYESSIRESGGTGAVTNFSFSVSRHVSNTSLDGFFNEFYPATSGVYLSSVIVQIGICWVGATADTDITWLFSGRVISYDFEQRRLNVTVFQESEITNKEIPYYAVQKDFNNGISYFTFAPQESYGMTIPIAYGDLTLGMPTPAFVDTKFTYSNLSPCIKISKSKDGYISASHKVFGTVGTDAGWDTTDAVVFYYISELSAYMAVYNRDASADSYANTYAGHIQYLQNTRGLENLRGLLRVKLTEISKYSDVEIDETVDIDESNYVEIDDGEIYAVKMGGQPSTGSIGNLSNFLNSDISVHFYVSNDGSGTYDLAIDYYNTTVASPAGTSTSESVSTAEDKYHSFGTSTTAKKDAEAWTIEELAALDYRLTNNSGTGGNKIRVYYAFVEMTNIFVQTRNQARIVRNEGGFR